MIGVNDIEVGSTYAVIELGDDEPMVYGVVTQCWEDGEFEVVVFNCTKTWDEWLVGTDEADFVKVDSATLLPSFHKFPGELWNWTKSSHNPRNCLSRKAVL